jgi:hypothetical protein
MMSSMDIPYNVLNCSSGGGASWFRSIHHHETLHRPNIDSRYVQHVEITKEKHHHLNHSECTASARWRVSESSPRRRRHLWYNFLSTSNCIRLARCWPATKVLMTPAIRRCLWTLISGSRDIDGGRGASVANTSGCAGAPKFDVIRSTGTASLGAVGSIKSGSFLYRCS